MIEKLISEVVSKNLFIDISYIVVNCKFDNLILLSVLYQIKIIEIF